MHAWLRISNGPQSCTYLIDLFYSCRPPRSRDAPFAVRTVDSHGVGERHGSYGRESDNGPLSLLGLPRGCVAEVLAVLKPGSNSQRLFQLVLVGIGPLGGQLPADGDGFLDRGQRILPPAQVAQPVCQVVQRPGQVGAERVRAGPGQLPVDFGGFLARGQRVLPPAQVAQPDRQVVQRPGQVGRGTRPGGPRPAPGRCRWLPRSRPARPPAGPGRPAGPTGCSATWPGRGGTRPGGPRPAPGRW